MTKHTQKVVSATAPCGLVVSHGAGAPEVPIVTREMREAGASVIEDLRNVVSCWALAEDVFHAENHDDFDGSGVGAGYDGYHRGDGRGGLA